MKTAGVSFRIIEEEEIGPLLFVFGFGDERKGTAATTRKQNKTPGR